MSRTGKSTFISLAHLSEQLEQMHVTYGGCPVMLIAEVKANNQDGTPMSAAAIAGRCQDESVLFPEAYMVVHDAIPYSDFVAGSCDIPYQERVQVARSIAIKLGWKYALGSLVIDEQQARSFADYIIDAGGEGAVFKQPLGTWVAGKKDCRMMKIKQELSYDLTVTGLAEGAGKYTGTTGTIECFFRRFGKKAGEIVVVSISGMSDKERDIWWNDPTTIIGQIVQVDAMRFTEFGMLREPRYKGIRYDKEQADIA